LDWVALLLFIALTTLGWFNIYASVYDDTVKQTIWDLSLSSGRQLLFMAATVGIILIIIIVDMRFYETFAFLFYGLFLLLLILVPIIGKEVGGNKAWLGIGSFGVQPSEFAKFATALAIAKYMGSVGFKMDNTRNQAVIFLIISLPMGLILLQKDFGTAMVFVAFMLVFFREGMSPFLLIIGISSATIFILTLLIPNQLYLHGAILVILATIIFLGKRKLNRILILSAGAIVIMVVIESVDYVVTRLKPHHQNRVKALINPDADPLGFGWNVTQSKIAIGSGGFAGKGFLKGTQTKFDFVPEQSTDFIFCTIGEEHGWLGSVVIICLFVALLLRIIYIAERQKSRF
jgi:rod shape determining protein RodA